MRKLFIFSMLLTAATMMAQTARNFTLNLTDDGKAQMVCFLPEKCSGKAIVGVPGGGYSMLSNTHEGTLAAEWMNQRGIAYFVVNYRLPAGDRTKPMGDVMKGIRIVRDSALVWNINPNDVGIMGFSAGGHLASVISTHAPFDARPNFSILFYPVISMDERVSHKWSCLNFLGKDGQQNPELVRDFSTMNAVRSHLTPPALIVSANDDRLVPFVTNGLEYYKAMRNAGNDCSMLVYPTGDHGFGFGTWFPYHDQLLTEIGSWLDAHKAPKQDAIRVACIGNSITDGYGIDMRTAYGYPAVLQKKLGNDYWVKTNDSKPENWQYGAEFRQDLEQMITTLRPDLAQPVKKAKKSKKSQAVAEAKPRILLCTPIPAFKPTWNINDSVIVNEIIPIQQEVAKKYGLQVVDLHTLYANDGNKMVDDGIHPDGKGAERLATIIAEALAK